MAILYIIMYCVEVATCRKKLFPLVVGHNILNGSIATIKNYYTPEANSLDAGMAGGKGLCNICSEKSKWKKNGVERLHSTKCCPYKYHFDIVNRRQFTDTMAEVIKLNYEEPLQQSYQVNQNSSHTISQLEDDIQELGDKITESKGQVNFLKSLISPEEIKKREENYKMMAEEKHQLELNKINVEMEIKELKANYLMEMEAKEEKLKSKELLLQIEEKRNKRIRNEKGILTGRNIDLNTKLATLRKEIAEDKNAMGQLEDECEILLEVVKSDKKYFSPFYNENCCICICDIGMDNGITTPCGHHFHFKCYSDLQGNFMKQHSYGIMKCPLCRKELFQLTY
jgi:hypothetical protein